MLPPLLDLLEKRVVVFGGGDVGLRKAKYFEDEADVIVVSREFHPGFDSPRGSRIEGEAMEMMKNAVVGAIGNLTRNALEEEGVRVDTVPRAADFYLLLISMRESI